MRVKLQGASLWEAVDTGDGDVRQERQALGNILCSVPPEMLLIDNTGVQHVFLNEERVVPTATTDGYWFLDTGASNHMTGNRELFTEIDEQIKGTVKFGDGSMVDIQERGSVLFACKNNKHKVLTEVYQIPRLKTSIVSLGQLAKVGVKIVIKEDEILLYDRRRALLAKVKRMQKRLYSVILTLVKPVCLLAHAGDVAWRWHACYSHLYFRGLQDLTIKGMLKGIPTISGHEQFCEGCALGKQHRVPFPSITAYRTKERMELTHGDLCGPITPETLARNKYFLLIVDDASRYLWVEMLKNKDEALRFFKKIKALAENESGLRMKAFRTDCGGEFISAEFAEFCSEQGLRRHNTAPYTPQQNGVVERRNQTVVDMARCTMKSMGCQQCSGQRRSRSVAMVFVGYEDGAKPYRVYNPSTKRLHITRDVIFEEERQWDWAKSGVELEQPREFVVIYNNDEEKVCGSPSASAPV
ncbi:Uncharacterized mitochondrial protein AtMg00300 [Striga hermonthica]|uniref:Uncharacterized mitochondrial protein AtMg00300 n=1 Tax=Striga hermonthica TaxID=68872 RepID=A0A9N7MK89_STRHE|nr:Uncharacterized mitochondrial protein AtMg00300 [Striga hermonthica]